MDQKSDELNKAASNEIESLKKKIRGLEEKLATQNDGTQVSRSDYEALEQRLKAEQDDHILVVHAYRDIESRLQDANKKIEQYKQDIKSLKRTSSKDNSIDEDKNNIIKQQTQEIERLESLNVKHRQDVLDFISEKKKLTDMNRRLESHISDVDSALVQMMERNKELAKSLQESENRNLILENELKAQYKNTHQLEREISKLKYSERRNTNAFSISRLDTIESNYADAKQKLILASNTINELKLRISNLEKEEKRAAQLQIELDKKKLIIQTLQERYDQSEMELESYRSSAEEFRLQIDEYRDKIQKMMDDFEEKTNAMKIEVEYYRKRTEKTFKENTKLEEKIFESNKEMQTLKDQLDQYLSGNYGLEQAVNEMRQLKTMISVRDAQIADMILEHNWYEKVINGLESILPPTFDFKKFFDKIEKEGIEEQQKNIEKQALELLHKCIAQQQNAPIGEVKIILGSNRGHKKTLVVVNDINGETQVLPQKEKVLDNNSQSTIINDPTQPNISYISLNSYSDYSSTDNDESFSDSEEFSFEHESEILQKKKIKKERKKQQKHQQQKIEQISLIDIPHVDHSFVNVECQTEGNNETVKLQESESETENKFGEDQWIRELRYKYQNLRKEKNSLITQIENMQKELEEKNNEVKTSKAKTEELLNEIDKMKTIKKQIVKPNIPSININKVISDEEHFSSSSSARTPRNKTTTINQTLDEPIKQELNNKQIQVYQPNVSLKLSDIINNFEQFKISNFNFFHNSNDEILLPTKEEIEKIETEKNNIKTELENLQKKASESEIEIEEQKRKISQKEQMLKELQSTIDNLETQLKEQRISFQNKIKKMNKQNEKVFQARLKEELELNKINNNNININNNNNNNNNSDNQLSEVSSRLRRLNEIKNQLTNDLQESQETIKFFQSQNERLRQQILILEDENNQMKEKEMNNLRHQSLQQYSSTIKEKFVALQKKYKKLQTEYENIKKLNAEKIDTKQTSLLTVEKSVDSLSTPEIDQNSAKLKSAQVKIETLKTQNEEMQLRLGKANATIERLNQLLQRKESQLTSLQEQASKMKHMLERAKNSRPSSRH
ncbi:hypothetical protein GPJ56_008687 [Histomonas meleagridis]|uniref:uncharacterized protein n=1 Tax=Histomonas meleagridis TaxID=135588 RepID=UPI00355A143C|nr:hypothetical protein GPJ56_008687 [Histomonas meleagridis]KAH0805734.1 hypothetical protein GO595_001373 [Histomonas meleagridis]